MLLIFQNAGFCKYTIEFMGIGAQCYLGWGAGDCNGLPEKYNQIFSLYTFNVLIKVSYRQAWIVTSQ